jgi:hypothetical protein
MGVTLGRCVVTCPNLPNNLDAQAVGIAATSPFQGSGPKWWLS